MKLHHIPLLTVLFVLCYHTAAQASVNIIPLPTQVEEKAGTFTLLDGHTIGYNDASLRPAALYLQEVLTRSTGYDIPIKKGKGTISLTLKKGDAQDESYQLDVTARSVVAVASSYRGITNAIASIRQLLPAEIETDVPTTGVAWTMPAVSITDHPNYAWRGLMLDPVRHFYTVAETKRLIDQMALYKYDKFHWHLIDNEGWRIEIMKYPELTKQGAWRQHNSLDNACLQRAIDQNNPAFRMPATNYKVIDGQPLYGGYYTQDEIREVVRYAAQRGLDVVPEIDMPGHNTIAEQVFPWLSCNGTANGVYCLGKDKTLDFAMNVWNEVFDLFPYEYVHIGGDEVDRTVWNTCDACQKRIKEEKLGGIEQLQAWFTRTMEKYFNAHNRKLLGWEEILDGGVTQTSVIYWWRGDHPDIAQRSTAMGNEVVICPFSFCYFDYGQKDNTLRKIYDGDIVPTDLDEKQQKLIRGLQANIWGEYIPTEARMQFMVFPRALAMAEKAWTPRSDQHWEHFLPRLQQHLRRLEVMKVQYRPLETTMP